MSRITLDSTAEVPDHLRYDARRTFKGRTVNLGSLVDDPDDAAWLADFLDGGTDPVEVDEEAGEDATVPEDGAEGETPDAEPQNDDEELVDTGAGIRQAFAQMPRSLMRKQDGAMLPDWERILAGIKGQSKKQLEERCLVAERRFRDSATRDAVIQEATKGIRGRNAAKVITEKHHAIWAAWRWLDRPANQEKIADVIRQAKDAKTPVPERKPTVMAPTPKDAVGVLLAKARQRIKERAEKMIQDGGPPSIMVENLEDCHRLGPAFHRLPGAIVETRKVSSSIPPPTDDPIVTTAVTNLVHICPKCRRETCPICKRPVVQVRMKLRKLAAKVLQ